MGKVSRKIQVAVRLVLRADDMRTVVSLVASLGGGIMMTWWAAASQTLEALTLGWRVLFWLGIVIVGLPLIVFIVAVFGRLRSKRRFAEFYDGRSDANAVTGDLESVIASADKVWCAWHAGTYAAHQDIYRQGKIARLILTHPGLEKGDYLPIHAPIFCMNAKEIASDVVITTRKAQEGGVQPRWFRGPLLNSIIIGNPGDRKKGWIRIEILMPFSDTPRTRPIVIIQANERPNLFQRLSDMYTRMWDISEEAPKQELDTEDSQKGAPS